jgi:peptide/nickel transport system substrate-binding protein
MTTFLVDRRRLLTAGASLGAALAARPLPLRAQAGASLRVAQPWEFRTLKLSDAGFAYTRPGLLETLVAADSQGRIVPALAESWSTSDDGRQWRFRIRRGMTFHDGAPCDAAAIQRSFERLLPDSLYLKRAGVIGVEAAGEELVFRLAQPFGPLLAYLVDNSVSVVAPSGLGTGSEVTALIGTGPYRLTRLDAPRAMTLARHDGYWGPKAKAAAVQYDAVPNGETRGNIAAAGDADLVFNIPTPSVARVQAGGAMLIERPIIPRVHVLMLNCGKPQFADVRARRALNMALDRQAIAAGIMRNPALAATQYMPPILADWHFADLAPHRHDVAAANALLDQAGWVRGGDGVRMKDGARFAGTIRTFANRPELPIIAAAMQAQFRAIGFDLAISVGEWSAIMDGQRDGTLELGLSSRNLTIVPDPIATVALDFASDTPAPGAVGTTNWRNDELRALVQSYFATSHSGKQAGLRRRMAGIIQDEVPLIPVVWYNQIVAVNRRVAGFLNDPFEQRLHLNAIAIRA